MKKLVWFKARCDWPVPGGGDASDDPQYEKGMVVVNFNNEVELKDKLIKYAISQLPEVVRNSATVLKMKYKIIQEI